MTINKLFRQKIFWKILVIFWLTTIATISANIHITKQIAFNEYKTKHLRLKMQSLSKDALKILETQGKRALKQWYHTLMSEEAIRVRLLYEDETPVIKPKAHSKGKHPHEKGHFLKDHPSHDRDNFRDHFLKLADQHLIAADGTAYILRILPSPYLKSKFNPDALHGYRLIASFIIIALGSLWIAHSIAKPIELLRRASDQIASGDFDVSIAKDVGSRRDELGGLARAFDEMAKKINALLAEKNRLFADISHEIRTPLTRQALAIELLRSSPENVDLIDKVQKQNQEIEHLISQLLNLLALQNDDGLNITTISIKQLLEGLISNAQLEIKQKSLTVNTNLINTNLSDQNLIRGDERYLGRAFENIMQNAIKYSPEAATLHINVYQQDTSCLIEFIDQGPGIPDSELDHILEPFYRTDKSRNSKTGGFGLGLAICSDIIAKHQGSLIFENISPTGLKVSVQLPHEG